MIYQALLGETFHQLHPKIQHRYSITPDKPFYAKGIMHSIETGSKLLMPMYQLGKHMHFLFPEKGQQIPFTLKTTCTHVSQHLYFISFERKFYFPHATRSFHTTTMIDLASNSVRDYLGEPYLISADLLFHVTKDGSLINESGRQHAVLGKKEIPLPSLLSARGHAIDGYNNDKDVYTIAVTTYNPLLGRIANYYGEFKETEAF